MAAPTTHVVISWAILRAYLYKRNLALYSFEGIITSACAFIFGFMIDIDHFLGVPKSFKEDLGVRFKKMLKMQSAPPSKGVELPIGWLHKWPGLILVLICGIGLYLFFPKSFLFCIPFIFWFVHWIIDKFQENNELSPYHYSIWYPLDKKKYIRKKGYPIKSQAEIIVSILACILIFLFELSSFLTFIF